MQRFAKLRSSLALTQAAPFHRDMKLKEIQLIQSKKCHGFPKLSFVKLDRFYQPSISNDSVQEQIQWILPAFDLDFLVCVRLVPRICLWRKQLHKKTFEDGKFSLNLASYSSNKDCLSVLYFLSLEKILQV